MSKIAVGKPTGLEHMSVEDLINTFPGGHITELRRRAERAGHGRNVYAFIRYATSQEPGPLSVDFSGDKPLWEEARSWLTEDSRLTSLNATWWEALTPRQRDTLQGVVDDKPLEWAAATLEEQQLIGRLRTRARRLRRERHSVY